MEEQNEWHAMACHAGEGYTGGIFHSSAYSTIDSFFFFFFSPSHWNIDSECACPTNYPVPCEDMKTCCAAGSTCVNSGNNVYQCQKGNVIAPTSARPTSGNSGNGTDSGVQAGDVPPTAAGNSLECTSGSVAVLIAIVAIFLA